MIIHSPRVKLREHSPRVKLRETNHNQSVVDEIKVGLEFICSPVLVDKDRREGGQSGFGEGLGHRGGGGSGWGVRAGRDECGSNGFSHQLSITNYLQVPGMLSDGANHNNIPGVFLECVPRIITASPRHFISLPANQRSRNAHTRMYIEKL